MLGLLQPFLAYFRPHPGTTWRPLFTWTHRLIALTLVVTSSVALFTSSKLKKANLHPETMTVYIIFYVLNLGLLVVILGIQYGAPEPHIKSGFNTKKANKMSSNWAKRGWEKARRNVQPSRIKRYVSAARNILAVVASVALICFIAIRFDPNN